MRHRDLITVGAYRAGSDPQLDRAVRMWPRIESFLAQPMAEPVSLDASIRQLGELLVEDVEPTTDTEGDSANPAR
jgi:flagellum-specific ATP synthase